MDATTVAVDLAKDVFEVATANRAGPILERERLTRRQCEALVDGLPAARRWWRINARRGMLCEHGMPIALGSRTVLPKMPRILADAGPGGESSLLDKRDKQ